MAVGVIAVAGDLGSAVVNQIHHIALEVDNVVVNNRTGRAVGVGQRVGSSLGVVGKIKNLCADCSVCRCGGDCLPQEPSAGVDVVVALRDGADQLHGRAVVTGVRGGTSHTGRGYLRFFLVTHGSNIHIRRNRRNRNLRTILGNVRCRDGGVRGNGTGAGRPYTVVVGLGGDGGIVRQLQHIALVHGHGLQNHIVRLECNRATAELTVGGLNG